jgi:DNA primase
MAGAQIIGAIDSPIVRERYIEQLAGETGFSTSAIAGQIEKRTGHRNTNVNNRYNSIKNTNGDHIESAFLVCIMANPQYIVDAVQEISADDLTEKSHKNIFSALYDSVKRGIQPSYAELVSRLDSEDDRNEAARLSDIQIVADDPEEYLKDCTRRIRLNRLERKRRELMDALRNASAEEQSQLLADISKLDKELNH